MYSYDYDDYVKKMKCTFGLYGFLLLLGIKEGDSWNAEYIKNYAKRHL